MSSLRAVLLDIDGTLVDSNDAHARAWSAALEHFGHGVPYDRVRALIGKGGDKLLSELTGIDVDSPHGKEIEALRERTFKREFLPRLRPFPKARELVRRLRDDGLRLVVATSAKRAEMEALLDVCGARELVHACTSSDDAEHSKPEPDIVQSALHKAGVLASEALLLGDTPYDIEAARGAYVGTVALRSGGWSDPDLDGALFTYDDVADVFAHYETSPFKQRRRAEPPAWLYEARG